MTKKYIFILFIILLTASDSLWACAESLMLSDEVIYTRMKTAIKESQLETVKQLIEAGANVNLQDKNGRTALMLASVYNRTKIVELLLRNNADPNLQDQDGWTALIFASTGDFFGDMANKTHSDFSDIIRMLLVAGADVNHQNNEGWTALINACRFNYTEHVRVLLEADGVDVNIKILRWTALNFAENNHNTEMIRLLKKAGATKATY